ncbi:MAG TPA: class I SAM-dependent methyltransferase [Anaerolineales bacterium]|nr:class I SAM-dependent methyltransferase [Anaerolineales bacterium]HLB47913.1 class I SAM-dependent methyltransferase [Anaerolineales bacterium]
MEPSEYENIARLEEHHWWYRGMAAISLALLNSRVATRHSPPRILDAGCGPGGMLTRLSALGRPVGIDFHPLALAHAAGRAPLARASVEHLPFADASFDLVTSFDVLYHRAVADDECALREFARVLRSSGAVLIRVPAWEALRGAHDVVVHTQRRYTAVDLDSKLRAAGFRVHRLTYANTLLFPMILLRRKLKTGSTETSSDVELPSPVVNRLLELVLRLEKLWLSHFNLPVGVSLYALASK